MPNDEIYALKDRFVEQLSPLKVYLFGSYAYDVRVIKQNRISHPGRMCVGKGDLS